MGWLSAILGIVSLVGSLVTAGKSAKKSEEADDYNKELNQTLMDREDSSWQRAVEDRSKAGLSVAGLSQGAGSGGTVSQLQSQQSSAFQSLSNVLQNGSGTMFGLANSAYDRKLQKEIATEELKVKKDQLKHEKLTTRMQYMMDLAQLKLAVDKSSDEHKIFMHNYKIATGEYTDPKYRIYGSEPSEIERLLTGIYNNRQSIKDNVKNTVSNTLDKVKSFFNGDNKGAFYDVPSDKIEEALGEFTINKINSPVTNIATSADGKSYYLMQKDGDRIELSKYQYNNLAKLIGRKLVK